MNPGTVVKISKSKKGNDIVIRYLKDSDLDAMLKFANGLSKEDTFVMLSGEEVTLDEERRYIHDALDKLHNGEKIQLVALVNGEFAGNCVIDIGRKRKHHVGTVSISVDKLYRGEGVGYELLKAISEEGKKAGLRLLQLTCFENNERALGLYEKIGFKRVGTIPGVYTYKGGYFGEIILYLPLV